MLFVELGKAQCRACVDVRANHPLLQSNTHCSRTQNPVEKVSFGNVERIVYDIMIAGIIVQAGACPFPTMIRI